MGRKSEADKKQAVIVLRINASVKDILMRSSRKAGISLSSLLIRAARREALHIASRPEDIAKVSEREFMAIFDLACEDASMGGSYGGYRSVGKLVARRVSAPMPKSEGKSLLEWIQAEHPELTGRIPPRGLKTFIAGLLETFTH